MSIIYKKPLGKIICGVVISLVPIVLQYLLVFSHTGYVRYSNISSFTLKNYFYSQLYAQEHKLDLKDARSITAGHSSLEIYKYVLKNPEDAARIFKENVIKQNLKNSSSYVAQDTLKSHTEQVNKIYSYTYYLIILAIILSWIVNKRLSNRTFLALYCLLLAIITVLESGISFWQGDRLVLGNIPLIIFACAILIGPSRISRDI
jgi:hypothetical protein